MFDQSCNLYIYVLYTWISSTFQNVNEMELLTVEILCKEPHEKREYRHCITQMVCIGKAQKSLKNCNLSLGPDNILCV